MQSLYSTDVRSRRERYGRMRAALWLQRTSFDAHWRDLADFLAPRRVRFVTSDRNRGDKRNQNILDSTGVFAKRTLQSGLHAGLTSPARPWMKLTTPDPDLAKFGPVKVWLHIVTQRMLTVFATSNLYNVLPIVYGDMGVFGTAAMGVLEDSKDLFRVYSYPLGSFALGVDARNLATTFVREYQLSVRQLVEQFGGPDGQPLRRGDPVQWANISLTVRALWDQADYESGVDVVWVVKPNDEANAGRIEARFKPWTSCYFEKGEPTKFLRESGFNEYPIMAPRWDVTGEDAYGTASPGMDTLGDVKQLQIMQRKKAQAIAKQIDPPLVGPNALRQQKTSLLPGDVTYVDMRDGMQGLRAIHEITLNIEHLSRDAGETQYRIQRGWYEDLFLMIARSDAQLGAQRPTAREIDERHEEKLLALGPVLERTNDELLDPLVDRVFGIMDRAGLLPPAPEELHGVALKVEYISIMAQAQKLVGVVGQDRLLQTVLPLTEAFPEIVDKIDMMQTIDNYGDMLGVDPRVIRPTADADKRVAQRQQAVAAEAQADQTKKLAEAAKAAGTTPMEGDTALSRIVQGVANGAGGVVPARVA